MSRIGLVISVSLCGLFFFSKGQAAVPGQGSLELKPPPAILTGPYRESVIRTLRQSLPERIALLHSAGKPAFEELKKIAFDQNAALQDRWRAITAMGQVDSQGALKTLEAAIVSREWFVRNAALIAMTHGPREKSLEWANRLLSDKALVVRTAAVQTIDKLGGKELSSELWNKLNAKENFRGTHSLWIRRHIVRALSRFPSPLDEKKFLSVLHDPDQSLHQWAIAGLEKITGKKLGESKDPVSSKREKWLASDQRSKKVM